MVLTISVCPNSRVLTRPLTRAPRACRIASHSRSILVHAVDQTSGYSNPAASTETITKDALVAQVRKYLHDEEGWEHYWIDSVATRISKRMLVTTLDNLKAVMEFLKVDCGLPSQSICNMAAISSSAFGRDVNSDLKPVVEYIRKRGASESTLIRVLTSNPKLLEYALTEDGNKLWKRTHNSKFIAYAEVDIDVAKDGAQSAHVAFFRENTAFDSAPVSPVKPTNA